ncbi:hypothetical protein [Vitiosangium sp. GDMCC 1.1324]|uniref:hypothetical protein n=1 Tax=Vitiosangium sp. (strain GDMCC 1.1324) TaxID=2138576 RepID=UPI00130E11BE|nr:hypothetical protein [Vitiosangium sp. GDMCC 1.1324]
MILTRRELYAEPRLESHLPDSVTRAAISSGPLSPRQSAEHLQRPRPELRMHLHP